MRVAAAVSLFALSANGSMYTSGPAVSVENMACCELHLQLKSLWPHSSPTAFVRLRSDNTVRCPPREQTLRRSVRMLATK